MTKLEQTLLKLKEITLTLDKLLKGGEGSGNFGHEGRPGEVGGSGEGGGGGAKSRAERAKESFKPATKEIHAIADGKEKEFSQMIGGERTTDNAPFDVIKGRNAVEIKTIIRGKNPKITMHKESRMRKLKEMRKNKYKAHTVVFHTESNKIFYKKGVGSFNLSTMKEVDHADLQRIFQ